MGKAARRRIGEAMPHMLILRRRRRGRIVGRGIGEAQ
jgi:hypothetical protein